MTNAAANPRRRRFAAVLLAALAAASLPAVAAPPGPAEGVDYRVVLSRGAGGAPIEIRRRGTAFRHEILSDTGPRAVILYDRATNEAIVLDGAAVYVLRLTPSEIGGFDAPAMMAGLVDGAVDWQQGTIRSLAGADCTEHTGTGSSGGTPLTGRFCVTPDGIVLSIELGGPGQIGRSFRASEFERGPQPAELFERPAIPTE